MTYLWRAVGLSPVAEYKFCPGRQWRFDWALPDLKIAIEQEGGIWTRGRHTRGAGWLRDAEKYNCAAAMGWRLFRFSPQQFQSGEAQLFVAQAIQKAA